MTKIKYRHFLEFKLLFYIVACFTDTSKVIPSKGVDMEIRNNENIKQAGVHNLRTTGNVEAKGEFPFQALHKI